MRHAFPRTWPLLGFQAHRGTSPIRGVAVALAATATLVGCAHSPAAPQNPPSSPRAQATTPAAPAASGASGGGTITMSPGEPSAPVVASPVPSPAPGPGLGGGVPGPVGAAPATYIAFTSFINGADKLMVYDDQLKDVLALPGAGDDVNDPQFTSRGILFERQGLIEIYNPATELSTKLDDFNLFLGLDVQGAFLPSADLTGTVVTAVSGLEEAGVIATPCGALSEFDRALISVDGEVSDLSKVEAIGATNDHITTLRISANGRWIVFTTGNGNLYLYDVLHPSACNIVGLPGPGNFAFDADVSPDGSQVVVLVGSVTASDHLGDPTKVEQVSVHRYDRASNCWDPMPYANLAENAVTVCDPRFLPSDPTKILLEVGVNQPLPLEDGLHSQVHQNFDVLKVVEYDWASEALRTLAILNSVNSVNLGDNKISSSGNFNGLPGSTPAVP